MDGLDEVEPAGIHNHPTEPPTYAGGEGGNNDDNSGWGRELVRRGWDLSRKAAIAGASVAAAPVVAPPLIVSAAGIALSVPFAAYLGSLAATNHLMSALLSSSPTQEPYHTCNRQDDEVDAEEEFLDASEEHGQDSPPAFRHSNLTEEGIIKAEIERDPSLLLSQDPGVSEASVPAFAEEVRGESSAQEPGDGSLASNSGDKTVEERESAGKEVVPCGFDVSESGKPLLQYERIVNVVETKGADGVHESEKESYDYESKIQAEKEDGTTKETLLQGLRSSESLVPLLSDNDSVVQGDGDGESSLQNLDQDLLLSTSTDKKESITMQEKKSTEDMPPRDFPGEDNALQSKVKDEDALQGEVVDVQVEITPVLPQNEVVLPHSNLAACGSPADLVKGEDVDDVQVKFVAAAAPEGEVLPQSSKLASFESPADLVTGEDIDMRVDIIAIAAPESEMLPLSTLCESPGDVTDGIVDVPANIAADAEPNSEVVPLSYLTACELPAVVETEISMIEDIVRDSGDLRKENVQCHFVSVATVVSAHDVEDILSSRNTPYVSAIGDEMSDNANEEAGMEYTVMDERFGKTGVAGDEIHCTEEQLREQLDTIRTITGYGAVPCPTLEGELAGLYMFVGVEPPLGSWDTNGRLPELNAEVQFLKSIIGVD